MNEYEKRDTTKFLLNELKVHIKNQLLGGNFFVDGVFNTHNGLVYLINVENVTIELIKQNRQNVFRSDSPLYPVLNNSEDKMVYDFVMKGGIKQSIESIKLFIASATKELKNLEDIYRVNTNRNELIREAYCMDSKEEK
jgi:hypothetical protein